MLNLFRHHPSKDREYFWVLLGLARDHLQNVRSNPPPEPPPDSIAALAFDPHITRKLSNFMPLRTHRLPHQNVAWNALADLLDGWGDICKISAIASLTTWKVRQKPYSPVLPARLLFQIAGDLCANFASPSRRPPYLRALTQVSLSVGHDCGNSLITVKSVFFNNQRVLEVYPIGWVVDRFFLETLGIEYKTLCAVTERAAGLPLFTIERKLSRVCNIVLLPYCIHNPTSRCCSPTFNRHGIIHPVGAGSLHGLC
jgi:hypothetical protein